MTGVNLMKEFSTRLLMLMMTLTLQFSFNFNRNPSVGLWSATARSTTPCTWTWTGPSNGKGNVNFDLRPLMVPDDSKDQCPKIIDGDIPCTPEIEPPYDYVWNFCQEVNKVSIPHACSSIGKTGVVLQTDPQDKSCFIVAHYDPQQHELEYKALDEKDISKGLSLTYPSGEKCHHGNTYRKATIDLTCANVKSKVVSAEEPEHCHYHLSMKSYYACPTSCAITANGLCDSHGHCGLDHNTNEAYCFCNEGYYGNACDSTSSSSSSSSYDGRSVQIGLLVTLLIVALGLTGGLFYMGMEVSEFRKVQLGTSYHTLPGGESEMVETVRFD